MFTCTIITPFGFLLKCDDSPLFYYIKTLMSHFYTAPCFFGCYPYFFCEMQRTFVLRYAIHFFFNIWEFNIF